MKLIKAVIEINSLRSNLSTITDVVFFLWNRHGRRILIFFHATFHSNFGCVLDRSNTMRRVNASMCAPRRTDSDPASVISDKKRKSVTNADLIFLELISPVTIFL